MATGVIMSMKKQFLVTLFLVLPCLPSPGRADDAIVGEWELTIDFGGQDLFATLTVSRNDDGVLGARWGINEVSDLEFDGQTLTFNRAASFGGADFTMNCTATLKDGQLEGSVSNGQVELPVQGVQLPPTSPALGNWDVSFNVQDRQVTARLAVINGEDGALDAEWITESGEHTVTAVRFENDQLTVERTVKLQDQDEFAVTYVAEVAGNTLTGKLESPFGDVTANGTRLGTELIGTWELTATTDEGARTRILTVYPDLTGRYDFFLAEIPVEVTLEGGQVTFHGEVGIGGRALATDFAGTLDDGSLVGELTSPRGVSRISGKRLER